MVALAASRSSAQGLSPAAAAADAMAPANDRESATENRAGVALAIADDPEVAFVNAELNDVPVLLREERLGLPSLVK